MIWLALLAATVIILGLGIAYLRAQRSVQHVYVAKSMPIPSDEPIHASCVATTPAAAKQAIFEATDPVIHEPEWEHQEPIDRWVAEQGGYKFDIKEKEVQTSGFALVEFSLDDVTIEYPGAKTLSGTWPLTGGDR